VEATVVVQGVQEPDGPKNVVVGGPGAGEVHGTAGDDAVYSNEESPAYARPLGSGVFVAPVLDTSAEVDSLFGEAGDDRLFAGYGDNVDGGAGYDTLLVSFQGASGRVIASFNAAGGVVSTTVAGATITGIEAIEWVEGSEYDDLLIVGNAAADHAPMFGMGGDDYLAAGADSGSLFGGEGNDTIDLLDALNPADHFGEAGDDRVMGGIADDRIFGGEGEDEIAGNDGADHLDGGDGADLIDGGGGNDSIVGGAGDDHLEGGAGNDFLLLQDGGDDLALGGDGNDVIYFGSGVSAGDVADGGDGRDAVVFQGYVTAVLNDTNLVGIESISIQSGANATFGDAANNFYRFDITTADGNVAAGQQLIVNAQSLRDGEYFTFDGSAESDGSFLIYAGHGVDRLTGGAGVDVFLFEGQRWGAIDRVDGGPGRDALVISSGNGLNRIEFGAESFINIESISLNNRYATDPSQKPSYDLLFNDGNVAPGATLIVNGSSIPLGQVVNIDGRGELDGNLILFGGSGHDVIRAGAGNDLLYGGGGQDSLAGSAGADVFRYAAVSDSPAAASDQISDFQTGIDMIDLGRIDADSTTDGDQAFSWIGAEAFSGAAGELRLTEENGRQRIEGDVDGDGIADFAILFQLGTAPVVQSDFLF
ncbi:MAG TPA: calcium-binding protein, partial [Allosphingosinicella sp.]|nr:calcium-binding protein [Allosphingosinicella sp.]